MGYELLLLPVPEGADIEEFGEALSVRVQGGHARPPASTVARELSALLGGSVPGLRVTAAPPEASPIEMQGPADLRLAITDAFLRVDVPYGLFGEAAEETFGQVFKVLVAAAGSTGWRAYDPQEAAATSIDDDGRHATQELYLSVMDQLYPDRLPGRRRDAQVGRNAHESTGGPAGGPPQGPE